MDPIVLAAGTALVGAMATDAWQRVRDATVAWWRRARVDNAAEAEAVAAELDELRPQILAARQANDDDMEQALVGAWRLRLQRLLRDKPDLAGPLRRLLEEQLTRPLPPKELTEIGSLVMRARASGSTRVHQAATRDPHITGR